MEANSARGMRLSAIVVSRGPREPLLRTLASLTPLADEAIVALADAQDTWSPPASLASQVQVARFPWNDDLAAAKNALAATARGQWILELEPGETLSAANVASVARFLANDARPGQAYSLFVRTPRAPGNLAAEQIRQVRLWSRTAALRYEGRVRPSLQASLAKAGINAGALPWQIDRGTEEHEPANRARWARAELDLASRELLENAKTPRALLALAQALHALGDSQGAAERFREALAIATATTSEKLEAWYGLITVGEVEEILPAKQIALCVEALEQFPLDAQLLCALGGATQASGRVDLAARAYHAAWHFGQVDETNWHLVDLGELAAVCCSLAQQVHGNEAAAVATAREALARRPASARLAWHLVDLLLRQGQGDEAWREFERAAPLAMISSRDALKQAFTGAALVRSRDWTGSRRRLEAAFLQGCREPICLRWLALVLGQVSDHEALLPVLLAWREAEPDNQEAERQLRTLGRAETAIAADRRDDSQSGHRVRIDTGAASMPAPVWSTTPAPSHSTLKTM